MSNWRQKRRFFTFVDELDFLFGKEPPNEGSEYSIHACADAQNAAYPRVKIQGLEKKSLIRIGIKKSQKKPGEEQVFNKET